MENNLYYTPELKDLHYGFEFEYKSKDDNWVKVTLDTWNRPSKENHLKYFTEYDLLRTLNHQDMACKYADLTCIRVKTLDQSDIESLGWKYTSKSIDNWYELKGNFQIPYTCFKIILSHGLFDKRIRIFADDQGSEDILFRGTIKNKSELIKLMQQLNIK